MRAALFFATLLPVCLGASILGINPAPSHSHQLPFLAIMKELAKRGHQVTVVTTDPLKDPPANFTQIDISFSYGPMKNIDHFNGSPNPINIITTLNEVLEQQLQSPQMQQLQRSEQKFDVVVVEFFMSWCYLGLVHKLGSPPLIGFVSNSAKFLPGHMGNPQNPSYIPLLLTSFNDHMSFFQRLSNTLGTIMYHVFERIMMFNNEKIMKKYFGDDLPPIEDMAHNISLLLGCNDFVLGYPMPLQPNTVELSGLHIQEKRKPLPKDIQEFLDGAESGVVYMSLGSNVKSKDLPEDKLEALLRAFSALPQRVLWKWEAETLPGKPRNVKVAKWLPQEDILAHPKVRLFVTQGGLQSFGEAAYHAVPLVGMPVFGDQHYNVAKMVAAGIGVKLDLRDFTEETALAAFKTVLEDPSYASNMRQLSAVFRDHQASSVSRGAWWVEYVARHQGARHLRPASLDLAWYQLLLLDVAAFVMAIAAAVVFTTYHLVKLDGIYSVPKACCVVLCQHADRIRRTEPARAASPHSRGFHHQCVYQRTPAPSELEGLL